MQTTDADAWRLQGKGNKQGSEGNVTLNTGIDLTEEEVKFHDYAKDVYQQRLREGVAREQARKDLPLSTYTEAYWKIDLHNLLHFLSLRMDSHAQLEIRTYANIIGHSIVAAWVPIVWDAFLDYRYNSLHLTALEINMIQALKIDITLAMETAKKFGWLNYKEDGTLKSNRERSEAEHKLHLLGINIPWKEESCLVE